MSIKVTGTILISEGDGSQKIIEALASLPAVAKVTEVANEIEYYGQRDMQSRIKGVNVTFEWNL